MIYNQVHDNMDMPFCALIPEPDKIVVCAEFWIDAEIIFNIIAIVHFRRPEKRQQPYAVNAQITQVIKFFNNSVKITNAITIAVP